MRLSKPRLLHIAFGLLALAVVSLTAHSQARGVNSSTPAAIATPVESILWSFANGSDGAFPAAGLITDTSGNLYGTTAEGGAYGSPGLSGGERCSS